MSIQAINRAFKEDRWRRKRGLTISGSERRARANASPAGGNEERAPRLSLIERNLANAGFSSFVPTSIVRFHCSDLAVYTCDQ